MSKLFERCFSHSAFLYVIYASLFFISYGLRFTPIYNRHDPDTFWHLALGRWMLENRRIVTTSIHSFSENLDYVAHEVFFQLIVASLYNHFGWIGLHLLSGICLGALVWGFYRLFFTAMKEFSIEQFHPAMHLVVFVLVSFVYHGYMAIRPQMISVPFVLWFFIWMLMFRMNPTWNKSIVLGIFSILISNFHGGVWPIVFVLWGMALIEGVAKEKKVSKAYFVCTVIILIGGFFNIGGWKTITYIALVLNDPLARAINVEWQPVKLLEHKAYLLLFAVLMYAFLRMKVKSLFHVLLGIGTGILAVVSYKHALYAILLLPYFIPDGGFRFPNSILKLKDRYVYLLIVFSLALFMIGGMFSGYKQPVYEYPVDEMNFILSEHFDDNRPKVLTDFTASAYAHFRGATILADGRWDPFISKESIQGPHQFNPIERLKFIFGDDGNSDLLQEEIKISKPDYLIYQFDKQNPFMKDIIASIDSLLGKPAYRGRYGYVWKINYETKGGLY